MLICVAIETVLVWPPANKVRGASFSKVGECGAALIPVEVSLLEMGRRC